MPGLLDRQLVALDVGGSVLGGLASSRLDKVLVRDEQLAVGVTAGMLRRSSGSAFSTSRRRSSRASIRRWSRSASTSSSPNYRRGTDRRRSPARRDCARSRGRIRGLEQVGGFGGKAVTLAEGQIFAGDSDFYKKNLATYASVTPAEVQAAMRQWLTRPALSVRLEPGERPPYVEAKFTPDGKIKPTTTAAAPGPKRVVPPVGALTALDFPAITHTTLANGIRVDYAQRNAVPVTQLACQLRRRRRRRRADRARASSLTVNMLEEGTASLDAQGFAEAKERLGVEIDAEQHARPLDGDDVGADAPTSRRASRWSATSSATRPSRPTRSTACKTQPLTAIAQLQKDPNGIAARALPALIFGADHPYAALRGGDAAAIGAASRDDWSPSRTAGSVPTMPRSSSSPTARWPS